MEVHKGNMPGFEEEMLLVLPRSGKQSAIILQPKSAKPFTLLGKSLASLSDNRQGRQCWAKNQHWDLAVLCGT
jgi:hypothetical protein